MIIHENPHGGLSNEEIRAALQQALGGISGGRVLLLPPDITRLNSYAGKLTALCWELLASRCEIDVIPALGTHIPMTREEQRAFFGDAIPPERFIVHNWREDVATIGEVPASYLREISEGLMDETVEVQINRRLTTGGYDRILSLGQVVPHEVAGMANYTKNILVGCGGSAMISKSHILGALYGVERIMGRADTPVRRLFDYAEERFLADIPLTYILTVTTTQGGRTALNGLYIGRERALFERAAALSQQLNITYVDNPIETCVVYLDPREFRSAWLGNKAIYRTRMAMAEGGSLIILAPGVERFGEDSANDALIRKYGYPGRERVLSLIREREDLRANLSVAAHLIHGSSDNRFSVTYCTEKLSQAEVEGVGFAYCPYAKMVKLYDPSALSDACSTVNGKEIYYISNPALGLWAGKGGLG